MRTVHRSPILKRVKILFVSMLYFKFHRISFIENYKCFIIIAVSFFYELNYNPLRCAISALSV